MTESSVDGLSKALGKLIRMKRDRVERVTLRDAALRTGVGQGAVKDKISHAYWGNFENGTQRLTPRIQRAVARAFKLPSDWANQPLTDIARLLGLPDGWEKLLLDDPATKHLVQEDAMLVAVQQLSREIEGLRADVKRLGGQPPDAL